MRMWVALLVMVLPVLAAQSAAAFSNPASVFCVQSGGRSEIRNGPRGQYGVCRLPNGRLVDEWAYYRAMRGQLRR